MPSSLIFSKKKKKNSLAPINLRRFCTDYLLLRGTLRYIYSMCACMIKHRLHLLPFLGSLMAAGVLCFGWTNCQDANEQLLVVEDRSPLDEQSDGHEECVISLSRDSIAAVTAVSASGSDGRYTLSVTLASPDLGCSQYADWWEVVSPDTQLLFRRILTHSHVDEQPFTRSGGPLEVADTQHLIIRGHMNPFGYGSLVFSGSIEQGFTADTICRNFGLLLADETPLPTGCSF